MIFIKKHRNRNRPGATRMSVHEDIARLLSHDWSDPQLDRHFARVVEKLTRNPHPVPIPKSEDEEEEEGEQLGNRR